MDNFLQRLGKGRRDCQGAFADVALRSMVEEMAYNQLRKALAAGDGAVPKGGKSPTYTNWVTVHGSSHITMFLLVLSLPLVVLLLII